MDKQRRLIVDLIDQLTHFAIFYGLFATALAFVSSGAATYLHAGVIAVPFIIYYFLRRIFKRMWVLVMVHMLLPLYVIVTVQEELVWLFLTITTLTLGIHSIACAFRKEIRQFRFFVGTTALVFILLAIPVTAYHHYHILPLYPVIILIVLFGRKMILRMQNMATMLSVVHLSSKQPVKKIISLDYRRTVLLVVALLSMTIAVHLFVVMPAFGGVVRLHHWLLEREELGDEQHYTWDWIDDDWSEIEGGEELAALFEEQYEYDVTAFFNILFIFLIIAAIVGSPIAIFGLYCLFRDIAIGLKIRASKNRSKLLDDLDGEIEFLDEFTARRRRSIFSRLWEHPTRRLYRKTARKYVKKGLPITLVDTPTEVAGHISTQEDITGLTEEYAKVRYGR